LKILHLVSVADSQSIPLELALALKDRHPAIVIAAFRGTGDHPTDHAEGEVTCLDARGSFDLRAIWRLRALLVRHAPDIVHLHHAVSAFWTVLLALSLLRVPILVKTEHNDHRAQPWHQRAINVVLFPLYRAIVCNSDTTLNSFSPIEKRLAGTRARGSTTDSIWAASGRWRRAGRRAKAPSGSAMSVAWSNRRTRPA
jgi:hypothetical protein